MHDVTSSRRRSLFILGRLKHTHTQTQIYKYKYIINRLILNQKVNSNCSFLETYIYQIIRYKQWISSDWWWRYPQEWEIAERVLTTCGMAERCVRAYNSAGRVSDGLRLSAAQLSEEDTRDVYMPLAEQLRRDGQLRKAEQIYIGLGEPDEAISMYKVSCRKMTSSPRMYKVSPH